MSNPWPKWVGVPYVTGGRAVEKGLDCYGLVVEVYKKDLCITLPTYDLITPTDIEVCADAMKRTRVYNTSLKIPDAADIQPYDLLLFGSGGVTIHIGIAIDKNLMLHTSESVGSVIESFKVDRWRLRLKEIVRVRRETLP